LVLVATSRTSWAPMFLNGSESSISRAIETPSFVIVGGPVRRSSTTLRPFGPRVTLTASARSFTPASSIRRASWLKWRILAMRVTSLCPGGDQDPASPEPAAGEIAHRVVDRVEWVGRRVQADLALRGERHQIYEVDV